MALTERPTDWHFIVPLPETGNLLRTVETEFAISIDQPIKCGGLEYPVPTPLQITATTRRIPIGAQLTLTLDGEIGTQCRRCGKELAVAIQEKFMYSYILQRQCAKIGGNAEDGEYATDMVEIPVTWLGSSIDISDLIWECIIVSLPVYAECPDGCSDVPEATNDKSIDPRFMAIADALENMKKNLSIEKQ